MFQPSNQCDWCGQTECKLVVDHDHDTDAIRGTLCQPCNIAEPQVRKLGWCQVPGYFDRNLGSYKAYRAGYNKRKAQASYEPSRVTTIPGCGLYRQDPTYWLSVGVTPETRAAKKRAKMDRKNAARRTGRPIGRPRKVVADA